MDPFFLPTRKMCRRRSTEDIPKVKSHNWSNPLIPWLVWSKSNRINGGCDLTLLQVEFAAIGPQDPHSVAPVNY
jgi:hypothetical protein